MVWFDGLFFVGQESRARDQDREMICTWHGLNFALAYLQMNLNESHMSILLCLFVWAVCH